MGLNNQLNSIYESLGYVWPELILTFSILVVLTTGLIFKEKSHVTFVLSGIALAVALIPVLITWPQQPVSLFSNMLRVDDFAAFFKVLFLIGGLLTLTITGKKKEAAEFHLLILAVVLGACLLVMSMNFVMVLLALELISLSSYLLVGFSFDRKSAEGSLKYFLFGTVATAVMIYGLSLLYGLAGTLDFSSSPFIDSLMRTQSPLLLVSCLLILAGFLFKMAAVPLHLWAPDVYEAAPTAVVAFLSVVPKLAGMAVLIKLVLSFYLFGQSVYLWPEMIAAVSIASILVGNLSALVQTNPKRMLAYSSVAQSGFMLVGLTTLQLEGIHFAIFYGAIFLLMNFLVFAVLTYYEKHGDINSVNSLSGLGRLSWFPAFSMLIGMVALTGLPPTAGFTAKLLIFSSLWSSYQETHSMILIALFLVGLLNTVVSLFFYLKIPYFLFIKEAPVGVTIKSSGFSNLLHLVLVIALIYLFLQPDLLMGWINRITFVL